MDDDVELEPDLLAYVEERLGRPLDTSEPDPDEVEEDTDDDDETAEDDSEPGEGESEPPLPSAAVSEDDLIEVEPGITLTRGQAKSYKQFEAILNGDPELYRLLDEHIHQPPAAGGVSSPASPAVDPPAAAPSLPELTPEDLEDPTIAALYATAQAQQARAAQQEQQIRQLTDVTVTREQEEVTHLILQGKESFAKERTLTPDEMNRVEAVALRMNVIPSLMRGVDVITGETVPRDRAAALNRAFDIAYNYLPEFRERAIEAAVIDRAKTTKRKQKLAGIGGASGSVPKNIPIHNQTDRRNAMIAEVAGMMGVSTENGE